MRIFAVDPGLVTGMALLDTVQRTFQVWQIPTPYKCGCGNYHLTSQKRKNQ